MFPEITNEDRAESAKAALVAFAEAARMAEAGEDDATLLRDLLTNLRHFCAAEKIDFQRAVAMSQFHFEAECNGE
jgi:hypothetical protein